MSSCLTRREKYLVYLWTLEKIPGHAPVYRGSTYDLLGGSVLFYQRACFDIDNLYSLE